MLPDKSTASATGLASPTIPIFKDGPVIASTKHTIAATRTHERQRDTRRFVRENSRRDGTIPSDGCRRKSKTAPARGRSSNAKQMG